ncbi:LSM8 homolog, U6 small nuclear RNA associated isoform X1 [Sphaerodactylus townsendi]|uniref:LSM8 homolog, U6 small nuclear RNA associated isoform X1 n=1 Tax=Sphaerodactylus townsendi TaxID=933632 RepID=UPI002026A9F1|nr:LSM8 homolog, U6 small nuclear RNA associated isoform X1 [Sphaerodactylus townsendi]
MKSSVPSYRVIQPQLSCFIRCMRYGYSWQLYKESVLENWGYFSQNAMKWRTCTCVFFLFITPYMICILIHSVFKGTLKGFDQTINLILDESHERVFSSSQGVEQVVLGLYIVRGDNVAVIGEIDEETDSALDLGNIRAEPLNSVVH